MGISEFLPLREVHLERTSELGAKLLKQIKSVQDGTKFISAEAFLAQYKDILEKKR
jgi:hypothetical protein